MNIWHTMEPRAAAEALGSNLETGLGAGEAARRLAAYGRNVIESRRGRPALAILLGQFASVMVLLLIAAAVVAGLLGSLKDSVAIGVIVVLYATLGFIQEYRAERAMEALKKLSAPAVRVLRDGAAADVPSADVVPGDVVLLEAGNVVSADVRLFECAGFSTQESALTGESLPVEKSVPAISAGDATAIGDRRNMAYMGTIASKGRARALVVATGMATELGAVAKMVSEVKPGRTPLQEKLARLGAALAVIAAAVSAAVFVIGLLRGDSPVHLLLTGVSVAVAIIPEGLPAVVTITLALGAQRMLKRRALIRKLPAVETLGSVSVICSDKTGTLTENRMTVVSLRGAGAASGRELPEGESSFVPDGAEAALLLAGAVCNDAVAAVDPATGRRSLSGDPTETALAGAAARAGIDRERAARELERVGEAPFDSERKRMTTLHAIKGEPPAALRAAPGARFVSFTKGAAEGLLPLSCSMLTERGIVPLDDAKRRELAAYTEALASQGRRTLGFAFRIHGAAPAAADAAALERDLVFCGVAGLIDPPRSEAREAVAKCAGAGIRTVMITGDHPATAGAIAAELGIADGRPVVTGAELDALDGEALAETARGASVFARVAPAHKLTIVGALQKAGNRVAMTGDGVNDAPALRKADIGVAMGVTGTDVAKEASDMVILDDNFATIVGAVEQGRMVYDNIRSFVKFSVAGNIGKVLVMILAPFLGKPLPLLPLQLLWLNLLTDGLVGLGLGVEPPDRHAMTRKPYRPHESVFSRGLGVHVGWVGAFTGLAALLVGAFYFFTGRESWQTMVFTTLAFMQVFHGFAIRSQQQSVFATPLLSNPAMLFLALGAIVMQLLVVYLPVLRGVFSTTPLGPIDLLIAVGAGLVLVAGVEIEKWLARRRRAA